MPTAIKLLTVAEAAERLGIDPSQVRRHVRSGALKATEFSERVRLIHPRDLERFARLPRQSGPKKKSGK